MVFSLPTLPSLPSLRNILDPEPQVLYPPSATNTPLPSPSAKARIKNLPPVPDDWAQERERGRRTSISSISSSSRHAHGHGLGSTSTSASIPTNGHGLASGSASGLAVTRPTHRRAQSAVPLRGAPVHVPHGRLTEFSLGSNLLASTSALSLPTLVEAEADTYIESGGGNGNGNHRRRGSRSSITSTASGMSSLPPSPRRPHASLPNPTSVPPPVPRAKRPVLSSRAWSVMDVRPIREEEHDHEPKAGLTRESGGKGLTRHQSFTRPPTSAVTVRPRLGVVSERRMSSSQVSDVAVLASWHFPDEVVDNESASGNGRISGPGRSGIRGVERDGTGGERPAFARGHSAMPSAGSSRDLADRLRSLAAIDTTPSTLHSSSTTTTTTTTTTTPTSLAPRFQPKLSHRYTHSSPNLNIHSSGPGHRRGLRQPTPLGSNNILSSSPGSLSLSVSTSDSDSNVEPASPVGSLASQGGGGGGKWYDIGRKAKEWSRRGSTASISALPIKAKAGLNLREDNEYEDTSGLGLGCALKGLELRQEEEGEEEEVYIDFDRI